jgi:hypothetical protein
MSTLGTMRQIDSLAVPEVKSGTNGTLVGAINWTVL